MEAAETMRSSNRHQSYIGLGRTLSHDLGSGYDCGLGLKGSRDRTVEIGVKILVHWTGETKGGKGVELG